MRERYAHETFGTAGWGGSPDIIVYDRELLKDGCIQLSDKPGAGFEINPDVAKRYLCEGEKWWDEGLGFFIWMQSSSGSIPMRSRID